uniref:Uncharacterized protein n=1 Tax=Arundo donax TaxID=35708 RepID=A0A0A9HS67_ARUDO
MFRPKNPTYNEVGHTASLYHLVHTAALLGAPITKRPNVFGGLLTAGIVLFSGTTTAGGGSIIFTLGATRWLILKT